MLDVGIESMAYDTPSYYLDLNQLAQVRPVTPNYYQDKLGQAKMAVVPPDHDVVTLGASAAAMALEQLDDPNSIHLVLFATESGIDQSKAAGVFLQRLLNLPKRCRIVELKQACYSATCAIRMALPYIRQNPQHKVLVIASDIARYGLMSTGESSQGAGAVAMVLSQNPQVATIEPECGYATEDAMDFWRPNYLKEAIVNGKFSCELYMKLLKTTFLDYQQQSGRHYQDHHHFLYHIPVPKLAENAHRKLAMIGGQKISKDQAHLDMKAPLYLSEQIGNCYTASLYLSLISLLDQNTLSFNQKRIGLYSYGSGAVAEYFSLVINDGYKTHIPFERQTHHLNSRQSLSVEAYEKWYQFQHEQKGLCQMIEPSNATSRFRLAKIDQHIRHYEDTTA